MSSSELIANGPGVPSRCWCGEGPLEEFSQDYLRCPRCETLVVRRMPNTATSGPGETEGGFYGRAYFESYQVVELGLPPIQMRARQDLPERCTHWLATLLKYKAPPAKVLEVGCAHGAFVALMRWAGFDAFGLELSPWVAGFAREHFNVPVLAGTVETQQIEPGSLDAVVMMDVLEHLPDPVATLGRCLRLLKPDGIVLIQTPQYREAKSLEQFLAGGDPFLQMLLPEQHIFLFSRSSVASILERVGFGQVAFEPAIFGHYDMFLAASREALTALNRHEAEARLTDRASGRLALALLDLRSEYKSLEARYSEAEADRAARLEVIEAQGRRISALEASCGQLEASCGPLQRQASELEQARRDLQHSNRRLDSANTTLARVRSSVVFKLMRKCGLWKWLGILP